MRADHYLIFGNKDNKFFRIGSVGELIERYGLRCSTTNKDVLYGQVIHASYFNDVNFCIAIQSNRKVASFPLTQFGSGASLNFEHSLTRAINELSQCIELYDEECYSEDLKYKSFLEQHEKLKVLIDLDIRGFFKRPFSIKRSLAKVNSSLAFLEELHDTL